jgi:lipopolysaccharide biosynthesis glycosyltransferase
MLPSMELPTYTIRLPSSMKDVLIRPFTVKEEKLLLMALQSEDEKEIIHTTKQVINNCLVSKDVDVEKLPFFDVDYLFIALRGKSVGESVDVSFKCNNDVSGNTCGNIFNTKIDIANVKTVKDESLDPKIKISPTVAVKMKYPTYAVMKTIMDSDTALNKKIHMIVGSIEYIQEKERVHSLKDMSRDELYGFVEGLTQDQFKKLETWIDNFPTFVVTAEATCNKCGFVHRLEYSDFTTFFV